VEKKGEESVAVDSVVGSVVGSGENLVVPDLAEGCGVEKKGEETAAVDLVVGSVVGSVED
jgi:hypothetical protein